MFARGVMAARQVLALKIEVRALAGELSSTFPLALLIVVSALVSGCASQSSGSLPASEFVIDVRNAETLGMDEEAKRSSQAVHSFLLGQLKYDKEDYKGALKDFVSSSELLSEPEPMLHVKLAELHLKSGDLQKALSEVEKGLEGLPDDEHVILLNAGILENLNRSKDAEALYRKLIEKKPAGIEPYILLATLYARDSKFGESIGVLKRLVKEKPDETIAEYYLARGYEVSGNLNEAERLYRKVSNRDQSNLSVYVDIARVLLKKKKVSQARAELQKVLDKDPNNASARRILGHLSYGEGNLEEALSHFQALEGTEGDSTETRFKIALLQIERQNYKEAIRELSVILSKKPDHAEARYYLGTVYAGSGRKEEALEELSKVSEGSEMFVKARIFGSLVSKQNGDLKTAEKWIEDAYRKDSADRTALTFYIALLREQRKFPKAMELIKEALQTDGENENLLFGLGVVQYDLGKIDESISTMESLIERNPAHTDALNFLAYTLAERGNNLSRAGELVEKALKIRPDDGFYLDTRGWIYYQEGKYKDAVEVLGRAVAATGDDPTILEHHGDALVKTNSLKKAATAYRFALTHAARVDTDEAEFRARVEKKLKALYSIDPSLEEK